MTATTETTTGAPAARASVLRWIADNYEQAQRLRIEVGERIRALLQGSDETFGSEAAAAQPEAGDEDGESEGATDVDPILRVLRQTGEVPDEVGFIPPFLARSYHRYYREERESFNDMKRALEDHVVWPWLSKVKGIGPTLACKLLARLDPARADHASAFWSYCGLGTVPAARYRCETCGRERSFPLRVEPKAEHLALNSTKQCKGAYVEVGRWTEEGGGPRCAQPRPRSGEPRKYDAVAKKTMYLVGRSFLKTGGKYAALYRESKAKLEVERPGWAKGRIDLTALRRMEKVFLSHLWEVWRTELGLPVSEPYTFAFQEHDVALKIDPWSMIDRKSDE